MKDVKEVGINVELFGNGGARLTFDSDEDDLTYAEVLTIMKMMADAVQKSLGEFIVRNKTVLEVTASKPLPRHEAEEKVEKD